MAQGGKKAKPFPVKQLTILSICRICEPIAFCSIFPYIYFMIDSFGIAKNDSDIALYAGMVASAFTLAEFSTGMIWGRISDKFGRKPVLLCGLLGTLISMVLFGFAQSYSIALLARAAGGFLNGNVGVIQTTVAEMVPDKEHQSRAYAIMPFVWCIGSIIGPAIGGALVDPVWQYPDYFAPGGFLEEYPYALPNLFCASVLIVGLIIGILFLEETHEKLKHKPDYGLRLGKKLVSIFNTKNSITNLSSVGSLEAKGLLWSPSKASYDTLSECSSSTASVADKPFASKEKPPPLSKAFTTQIIHCIISHGILAYHTMSFEQLFPVFLSTPPSPEPPSSLFKFTGGFGLSTQEVGFILTVQGVLAMFIQFIVFPPCASRFGILSLYRFVMLAFPLSYIIVPYLDFLPMRFRDAGIYAVLIIKNLLVCMAYPCNFILLTNSTPSLLVLGAINGVMASVASLCRTFGPTLSGIFYSTGLDIGYVGLAWWVNAAVCGIGAIQVAFISEPPERIEDTEEYDEEVVVEMAVEATIKPATVGRIHRGDYIDEQTGGCTRK